MVCGRAILVMTDAHQEDYRQDPKDVLAPARSQGVWIPRGTQLARKVIRNCFRCKAQNRRTETQIMAKLPEERLKIAQPFQFTALDLFRLFQVKDVAKGRRRFKCWELTLLCLATRAAALCACPGYNMANFLATYGKFTLVYGHPERPPPPRLAEDTERKQGP